MNDTGTSEGTGIRVFLRPPIVDDTDEFTRIVETSREFLHPWVDPPADRERFLSYLERSRTPGFKPLLICSRSDSQILGAVNLSQISYGNFCSAYVGFWIAKSFAGQGLMSEALSVLCQLAFGEIGLHRLEMNVQPANQRCVRLMKRLGIRREGFSPRYLRVNGIWADHERWAVCAEDFCPDSSEGKVGR
jgi:ribosomal-protein-alanine N-acetyltransferase